MTVLDEGTVRELVSGTTEGPWRVGEKRTYCVFADAYPSNRHALAMVPNWGSEMRPAELVDVFNVRLIAATPDLAHTALSLFASVSALQDRVQAAEARALAAEQQTEQWKARMNHACYRLAQRSQASEFIGRRDTAITYAAAADVVSEEYKTAEAQAGAQGDGEVG